ncbi:hypothetical protein [Haladaptatus cibarius]|uniref:hypothetical protein n=1 Tax=Haladaptatus cibarius TaxID=453847 RepID=UPI0006797FDC|nr:hypothetical protein [Haladaptatus cibarius]
MSDRRPLVVGALAVFAVAVAVRTLPLYWTPLPYNLDGFHFVALAQETIAQGHFPARSKLNPDEYAFTTFVAAASTMTGVRPIVIAQPLIAVIGAVPCLVVAAIARRFAERLGWTGAHVGRTAILAGLFLAVEGIYLGRSVAVTSEGLGLLFVVLLALAFHRTVHTARFGWAGFSILLVGLLPITHNLASMVGALVVTAIFVSFLFRPTARGGVLGGGILVGFWAYLGSYYAIAGLNEVGRLTALPGLFVAWGIVLVALLVWLPTTTPTIQRVVPSAILVGGALVFLANLFLPVFPGTASTEPLAVALTAPLLLVGFVAVWGLPYVTGRESSVATALLFAPIVLVGFALSGNPTVEYQDIAARGQIYLHLSVAILAALAAVDIGFRRTSQSSGYRRLRRAAVPLLLLCLVVSSPLAFAGLRATPAQPTVTPAELQTATFTSNHVPGQWASDGHIAILATNYYTGTDARYTPIYEWLRGGTAPPNCPVVAQRSWTTVGAQLFPASPATVNATQYDRLVERRNVVYTVSSDDPLVLVSGSTRC